MSTRTRDWSKAIPIDHTQIKYVPTKIRDVREDLDDRLSDILAGFTAGETVNGIKICRLLTVGTATSTNPGTGVAAAIDIIGITTGGMTEVFIRNSSGNEVQLTYQGRLLPGKLANDTYMQGIGTGSGTVNIFKINTAGITEFATHPIAPDTNPSVAAQYAPKAYLDNKMVTGPVSSQIPQLDTGGYATSFLKSYDSGWFAAASNTTYTKTHSLGTTKCLITILFSENDDGSGLCTQLYGWQVSDLAYGAGLCALSTTQILIRTSTTIVLGRDSTGTDFLKTSGYLRVIMLALG